MNKYLRIAGIAFAISMIISGLFVIVTTESPDDYITVDSAIIRAGDISAVTINEWDVADYFGEFGTQKTTRVHLKSGKTIVLDGDFLDVIKSQMG